MHDLLIQLKLVLINFNLIQMRAKYLQQDKYML